MTQSINPANLNKKISPSEDFYHYANGGWLKKNPIPDEFSRYGTFDLLREENKKLVKTIIEEVAANSSHHEAQLVDSFYKTGMDQDAINKMGVQPILDDLNRIEQIKTAGEISGLVSSFYSEAQATLFYLYPSQDRENATMVISNLHQGGMGLSDVDYYRNDDDRSSEIRAKYKSYITQMLQLANIITSEPSDVAERIFNIESKLAHAGMTRLEQRDPHLTFNKLSIDELSDLAPNINWNDFLQKLNLSKTDKINVGQPNFFKTLSSLIEEIALDDWKYYFKWRILNGAASQLSQEFEEAKFNFYSKFLSGKKEMQPRWKRVTATTEDALGEAIGKLFVDKYFPESAKKRMLSLVENLRNSLKERINELDWMSENTKKEAREKLRRIRVKIGYPDKWRTFEDLKFNNHSYYENHKLAAIFNMYFDLSKIGKASDKDEWHMTPQTVNAYYHPLMNEIVFPAGILQPPFFYNNADDAVNYGAIGVVIGHEMTHGFDDQGRKFDKEGNLNDWWSEEDANGFAKRAEVLEKQFNKMIITDGIKADGKLSLGENIADLGGLNIAFSALLKAWENQLPEKEIDGFSPEQRFFLSYAHLWANNIREKEMIRMTKEDVHSLGINRVNGPLPNVQAFIDAFNIPENSPMYLPDEDRAKIW